MNTSNLDALIAQANQAPDNIIASHRADMKKRQLDQLFATHGPALVAVLKRVAEAECSCDDGAWVPTRKDEQCLPCDAANLLTQLDQEATCQK